MTLTVNYDSLKLKRLKLRAARIRRAEAAATDFLHFIKATWTKPALPFIIGRHTAAIAGALDMALTDFLSGQSTCLDIEVPYRHGKSDLLSIYWPPYFLGRTIHLHTDAIITGYGEDLVRGFSKEAKSIINSPAYREIFPNVRIARGSDKAEEWQLEGSHGKVLATGLGGGMTGYGAAYLGIDDFCRNKEQARSEAYRRNMWDAFTVAMSRIAPVHIVALVATSWHVDDVRGRLKDKILKDPNFPRFKRLRFPAKNPDGTFLFPERFSDKWYLEHYALEGETWAAALLDCNPVVDGGNRFKVDRVKEEPPDAFPKGVRYIRAWDLASSSKQREKDDPDFTCGMIGTVTYDGNKPHLWLKDAVLGQWTAPERNRRIIKAANEDGAGVPIYMESFGAYKDAFEEAKEVLRGLRAIYESRLPGDKSAKCAEMEQVFEAGNVHVPAGAWWLPEWRRQFKEFPFGKHDDCCDGTAICYHEAKRPRSSIVVLN